MLCDLHIHTLCSDGCLSPAQAAAAAAAQGIGCLAVTDHDTMRGVPEAQEAADALGIRLISGAEFSSGPDGETHILSYGARPDSPVFLSFFRQLQSERRLRAEEMLHRLREASILPEEAVLPEGASIGRPHIARLLVRFGACRDVSEAFDRFLAKGRCAYIPRKYRETDEIIRLIRSAGGVPVLAHPALLRMEPSRLEAALTGWIRSGLMGLEVYHPSQTGAFPLYASLASKYRLLVTGGSDYHDPGRPTGPIGCTARSWQTAEADLAALLCAAESVSVHHPGRMYLQ